MWQRLLGENQRRRRLLARAPAGPMRDFLNTPFPQGSTPCSELCIVSLDFETTGLDRGSDHILSIGLVELQQRSIRIESAWHQVIRVETRIPESSAVIHRITDDQAAGGLPLGEALPALLERIAGKVLLVHHAGIEQGFLDAACRRLYHTPFLIPIIDTQVLAQRLLERQQVSYRAGDLRLFNLRRRFHLPAYRAHNALLDAIATAELFLALVAELDPSGRTTLRRVTH